MCKEQKERIERMAADIRLNMQIQPNPKEHPSYQLARLLVQDGYRKASEVALEVIEEASEIARRSADEAKLLADSENDALQKAELRGEQIGALLVLKGLAELKKKYTKNKGE